MISTSLYENFDSPQYDPRLAWFNPPQRWQTQDSWLQVNPGGGTDYWQQPQLNIHSDNGPFLYSVVQGNFVLTARVRMHPANQYDQAGLMVRFSPFCWLKTSVEFESGIPSKLGAVITHQGYSDWSTQDYSDPRFEITFRIRREGGDFTVDCSPDGFLWTQIRYSHLAEENGQPPVQCGLYACSPIAAGYLAEFDYLKIDEGQP
jgi:regulation of enolase protein 1 (concanavalin A-like superfamily)